MKKYILGLAIIHFVFLFPLFKTGIFDTHDGQLHIARIAAYDKAITDGQFPVRWAANLNYNYGSPLFIFYYPLPYMLGTLVHRIGFDFTDSFKILLGLAFVFAPASFYLWMKTLVSSRIAAVSALVYGLSPYHFLDLFVRGAIGELFAFVSVPIVLLGIEKIYNRDFKVGFLLVSSFYAILILSHNAFALLFSAVIIFYALLRLRETKQWLVLSAAILLGLGVTAHFWLPSMIEQKYSHVELFTSTKYLDNFPKLGQLIWSPWGLGKEVTKSGGLSPQIGPIQILMVFLSLCFLKRIKGNRWLFWFGITLFIAGIYFSLDASIFIWNHVTFLKRFEFPWRFTGLISFAAAIMSAFLLMHKPNNIVLLAISSGLILLAIPLTRTAQNINYPDSFYETYDHSTDFGGASTIWTAGDPFAYPKSSIEIISGNAFISKYQRQSTRHTFSVHAATDSKILDNTLYYPGWKAYVDNREIPIQFQDSNHRGLITFDVPKGESKVKVFFEETTFRKIADIISILSVIVLMVIFVFSL